MTLLQLTTAVQTELDRRNLKSPKTRGNALKKVAEFITIQASEHSVNGHIVLPSDKNMLKKNYECHKGAVLNGAESSVINEIYNQYQLVMSFPKTTEIRFKAIDDLRQIGFEGFVPISDLWKDHSVIPNVKGVYMVVRTVNNAPEFLTEGTGGFFKGKDPNVTLDVLRANWVNDTCVIYIGQAGGIKNGKQPQSTLRSRLKEYLRFGQGKPVGHQGGCYIWQLKDAANLLFCWMPLPEDDPRTVESSFISSFKKCYGGHRPFANRND